MTAKEESNLTLNKSYEKAETLAEAETLFAGVTGEEKEKAGKGKVSDFITEYASFLASHVPTSWEWCEDLATGVLSTVIGLERYVATSIGRLRLNIWHVFIGPSGLAYKTIPLKDYVIETLLKIKEITGKDLLLPSSFSMEGMIEHLMQNPQGLILRDEVTTLFKEKEKGYAVDIIEFLSQLYDGTLQKRFTRKAKLEEVVRCYVVFLGSTTSYIYDVVEPSIFVQGLGNRILFEFWDGTVKHFNGDELFYQPEDDAERETHLKEFAKGLAALSEMKPYFLRPEDTRAAPMLANFKNQMDEKAASLYNKDPHDLLPSYLARAGEMAIKLAGLKAISRMWRGLPKAGFGEIIILPQDVEWAIAKVERHIKNFEKFLSEWKLKPKPVKIPSYKPSKDAVVEVIKGSPDGIMTQEEVLEALGWYKCSAWYELRKTLEDEGKIRVLTKEEIDKLPLEVRKRHRLDKFRGELPKVLALA